VGDPVAGAEADGGALPLLAGDGESPAVAEAVAEEHAEGVCGEEGVGVPLLVAAPGLPVPLCDAVTVACCDTEESALPLACAVPEALPLAEAGALGVAAAEAVAAPAVGVAASEPLLLPIPLRHLVVPPPPLHSSARNGSGPRSRRSLPRQPWCRAKP
jgi:hypothetical protein